MDACAEASGDVGRGRPVVVVTTISASLRLTTAAAVGLCHPKGRSVAEDGGSR